MVQSEIQFRRCKFLTLINVIFVETIITTMVIYDKNWHIYNSILFQVQHVDDLLTTLNLNLQCLSNSTFLRPWLYKLKTVIFIFLHSSMQYNTGRSLPAWTADSMLYAIKRILLNLKSVMFNRKITREENLLSRLNHENIVR